ncbi:hypothetical protein O181_043633 [Austropuccinia psidii MF-1]|uniref:DUF4939 domain-containing protein n=1 Tax=Austropuccinia psidii MF-1 TaxID=1389203 RepID=A0A9Q3HFV8_9BASI|nr:hypothetical protein [Austropuccinia psidii MF-1]
MTTFRGPGEDGEEEEENSVEAEESYGTEGVPAAVGITRYCRANSRTQIMASLQAASSSEASRTPAFMIPFMKAPEFLDGTQPVKVTIFIQSCQLFFHNEQSKFSQYTWKVLYATSFLIGSALKWIKTFFSNLPNKDPNYLLN